jgi:DNA-binding XRE family transcriptional regulator
MRQQIMDAMGRRHTTAVDVVVGQNIRMYRMRRGLSQSELGRRIGVAQQQIQKYEEVPSREWLELKVA